MISLTELEEQQHEADNDQHKPFSPANIGIKSQKEESEVLDKELLVEDNSPTSELEEAALNAQEGSGINFKEDLSVVEFQDVGEAQTDDSEAPAIQSPGEILSQMELDALGKEAKQEQGELTIPILLEVKSTIQQENASHPTVDTRVKSKVVCSRESCRFELPEVFYKSAARVIQDPTIPLYLRPCAAYIPGTSVRGAQGGSNCQDAETMRRELLEYRRACSNKWESNPACSVPMRAKRYVRKARVRKEACEEEWRIWEEQDKDRRDHELAVELGYETLVGNLLYIDIPGGKDINRSWQNFLSGDLMEWGFPYEKGSIERPRMKQPEPYLAHQVKEKLWKFPRARTFQTTQEE